MRVTPSLVSLPVVLCVCQAAASADTSERMPHVGVLVRNFSEAPAEVIQRAEAACQKIFHDAGIRITWFNTLDKVAWQGPDLVVDAAILSQTSPSRPMGTFGTALRDKQTLLIYHGRIVRFSKVLEMPAYLVLSLALVHEIGHILLDSDEHTADGIMRAEWGQSELSAIRQSRLGFTVDQSRRMKLKVKQRPARAK